MKVKPKGQFAAVNLTQSHFVATGGQASVYIKDGKAYKIYTDPKDTIPESKFQELSTIQDPFVIKPQVMLLDEKNNRIGYVMDTVQGSASLCQVFTKGFRLRNKIENQQIIKLVADGQVHIGNIHKAGCLIVDLNENNELLSPGFDHIYFLDVDSYQTKSYPATVLNPSVRDYSVSSKDFSALSDWFSWAVLAFQMFIGIHPYKGSYVPMDNLDKDHKLEQRMRQRISAFHKGVDLPRVCYPFDVIPQHYKDWLLAVLEQGKRCAPPDPTTMAAVTIQAIQRTLQFLSGALAITEIYDLDGWDLVDYAESNNRALTLLSKNSKTKVLYSSREIFAEDLPGTTLVGFTPQMDDPIGLNLDRGKVTLISLTKGTKQVLEMKALQIAKYDGRFYIRTPSNILELILRENPSGTLVTYHPVASVLEHATELYEGIAIQNMMGSAFVSIFHKSRSGCQVRMPELDKYRIVEAKFERRVLMTLVSKGGKYHRQVFRFSEDYSSYDYRIVDNISPVGINFITLPSDICLNLTEDEKLEAFSAKKDSTGVKVIDDPAIGSDMTLLVVNGKAGFQRNNKIFQISLK
jgi:hypothetical protein